jgi:hypothetical protein
MWWMRCKIVVVLLLALMTLGTGAVLLCRIKAEAQEAERPLPALQKADAPRGGQVLVYALVQLEPPPGENFDLFRKTQITLVKSALVVKTALKRPELAAKKLLAKEEDPVRWLEENLVVDFPNEATVLRIGLPGRPRQELAELVNAVTETYLDEVLGNDRTQAKRLRDLDELADTYRKHVEQKRQSLRDLTQVLGIETTPQMMEQYLQKQLGDSSRERRRVKLAAVAAQVRLERLKASRNLPGKAADIARLEEEMEVFAEQEKVLRQEEKELLTRAGQLQMHALQLQALRTDVEHAEKRLMEMQAQLEDNMRVMRAPRFRLLQKAEVGKPK